VSRLQILRLLILERAPFLQVGATLQFAPFMIRSEVVSYVQVAASSSTEDGT
jgi:hypothetical protein